MYHRFDGIERQNHETTKDRCWRRLNSETCRESGSQLSTSSHAKRLKSLAEADRETCPRQNEGGKPFCKDLPDAVSIITKESTHMQDELYTEACAGQVCHHASILVKFTAYCGKIQRNILERGNGNKSFTEGG